MAAAGAGRPGGHPLLEAGHRPPVGPDEVASTGRRPPPRMTPRSPDESRRSPAAEAPSGPVTKSRSPGRAPERSSGPPGPPSSSEPTTAVEITSAGRTGEIAPHDRAPGVGGRPRPAPSRARRGRCRRARPPRRGRRSAGPPWPPGRRAPPSAPCTRRRPAWSAGGRRGPPRPPGRWPARRGPRPGRPHRAEADHGGVVPDPGLAAAGRQVRPGGRPAGPRPRSGPATAR